MFLVARLGGEAVMIDDWTLFFSTMSSVVGGGLAVSDRDRRALQHILLRHTPHIISYLPPHKQKKIPKRNTLHSTLSSPSRPVPCGFGVLRMD